MFGKRVGAWTDATKSDTDTLPRDPGAMSGLLTGISFIAGVGGAWPSQTLRSRVRAPRHLR